jgi:auxin efflux carrier family protein
VRCSLLFRLCPSNADEFVVGVSFVAIFICIYHIIFWVFGAAKSLSWDYKPGVPQGAEAEVRMSWKEKPIGGFIAKVLSRYNSSAIQTVDGKPSLAICVSKTQPIIPGTGLNNMYEESDKLESQTPVTSLSSGRTSAYGSATTVIAHQSKASTLAEFPLAQEPPSELPSAKPKSILTLVLKKISSIVTPITATIAVALPIALIKPLKALFVDTTSTGGPNWKGPDGRPPLQFILESGSFLHCGH